MAASGRWPGRTITSRSYAPETIPYAIERYVNETGRLYAVLDRRLRGREFIVGDYSIADIACYPWVLPERQGQNIEDFPDLKRWKEAIAARPATQRAYAIAKTVNVKPADARRGIAQDPVRTDATRCDEFSTGRGAANADRAAPREISACR